jgi:hypothetical protein
VLWPHAWSTFFADHEHAERVEAKNSNSRRDLKIFQCLERYRYLRSAHLYAFVGGASEKRFKERLGDLFHEGYLDRPRQQWQFAGARYQPAIHEIDARGRLALSESGISMNDARTFLASNASRQFAHSLMICEVLASIELGARQYPNIRLIPWPEILARAPDITRASPTPFRVQVPGSGGTAVPDGLFGLEYSGSGKKVYRFFALEADRGTMPIDRTNSNQTSYLGKIAAYRQILAHQVYKSQLGLPNLFVLTITTSEARTSEIMRRIEGNSGSAPFLFKTVGPADLRLPAPRLLTEPWARAGLLALRIDA